MTSKIYSVVNCHLCPLKELCSYAQTEISYTRSRWLLSDCHTTRLSSDEDAKLRVATANCPLRKLLIIMF